MKAATIGTFDGLHRGHRKVLETLREEASKRGLQPMVMTFDRHPLETIDPKRAPGAVYPPSDKTNDLYREGLRLHVVEFTPEVASLSAREWMRRLHDEFEVRMLIVGYDNTFGHDGVDMSVADYIALGKTLGIEVLEAPLVPGVSSSEIRRLVEAGDVEKAGYLLDHPYILSGTVEEGRKLGRQIGFPTANIRPSYRAQLPADGVYEAEAELEGGARWPAVVNVGSCPTVSQTRQRSIEAHIIGYEGNLYGHRVKLRFNRRLRQEMKFTDIRALKAQIAKDVACVQSKY